MEMEASILCSITGHEEVRSDGIRGEKRKSLRIPMSMRVKMTVMRPQPRVGSVIVREISARGIGLLGDQVMEAGAEFAIEFPRQKITSRWAMYRGVRCNAAAGAGKQKLFFIGALFIGMLESAPQTGSAGKIEALTTAAAEASELDRIRQAVLDF
jgi:hypothetical protein